MVYVEKQNAAQQELQILTFAIDNVAYGVGVHQVREVKKLEGITPVPYAPSYVRGITNLRGEVVPVIDLRRRFGISEKRENNNADIMIILQDKHPVGVLVDSVMEVLTLFDKDVERTLSTSKTDGILGVAKHDNELIIILDLAKVTFSE